MIKLSPKNLPSAPSASPDIQANLSHLPRLSIQHAIALAASLAIASVSGCIKTKPPLPTTSLAQLVATPKEPEAILEAAKTTIPVMLPEAGVTVPTDQIYQTIHDAFVRIIIQDVEIEKPMIHFCSGWIAGPSTFVTAAHCFNYSDNPKRQIKLQHFKTDSIKDLEFADLTEETSPTNINFAYSNDKDLAVITTNLSVASMPARLNIATSADPQSFYIGHFQGYDAKEVWQIDSGNLTQEIYNSEKDLGPTYSFIIQCGNSGGAIFDGQGHVVGIATHLLTANNHGLGPDITKDEIEEIANRSNAAMHPEIKKDGGK